LEERREMGKGLRVEQSKNIGEFSIEFSILNG
jgi:hypothetical protein